MMTRRLVIPADWPDPDGRPCHDCGHIWFAGERRHGYLVGDGSGRIDEALVLCQLCALQRRLEPLEGGDLRPGPARAHPGG